MHMTKKGFVAAAKKALERLSEIELYHEDIYEDEDLDGDWTVERFTVYDGTIRDVYAEEIETLKMAMDLLEDWGKYR